MPILVLLYTMKFLFFEGRVFSILSRTKIFIRMVQKITLKLDACLRTMFLYETLDGATICASLTDGVSVFDRCNFSNSFFN